MTEAPMTFVARAPEDFRRAVALLRRRLVRGVDAAGATLDLGRVL
jgi:hypothetical protein